MHRLVLSTLLLFMSTTTLSLQHEQHQTAIVIHGGAGTLTRDNLSPELEAAYLSKLEQSVTAGHNVLAAGGSSTDAVIAAIVVMEDSELFNAGKGAVFTHDAHVELDASIMEGKTLNAGAVTGVRTVQNPIVLAHAVLTNSPHVMLMGRGAEEFAREQSLQIVPNDYFHTPGRRQQLERALGRESAFQQGHGSADELSEDDKLGTVGAVAIDQDGTIAAGTSTGGMTNKRFGRIGDSPVIGAGTYADNNVCGISATGHGEYFIRAAVAHDICARALYQGISLKEAADAVILGKLKDMGGRGGIIGIDSAGQIVMSMNTEGMYRASIDTSGKLQVKIYNN
jgi:L-asparaginase / beta-aspartyl-peptidase